jgi:ABC-type transporter Mla MlaB component
VITSAAVSAVLEQLAREVASEHTGPVPRSPRVDHRTAARAAVRQGTQPGLTVDVRQHHGRPVVTVSGELDLAGAGLVTAVLDHVRRSAAGPAGRRDRVDVDLAAVTFVDTHGLAAVVDAGTRVVAVSQPVQRLRRLLDDLPRERPRRSVDGQSASA